MDLSKIKNQENKLLEYLATADPGSPEFSKAATCLQKLVSTRISAENASFERDLKKMQQEAKEAEEKRRYDLDWKIKVGALELEKEEKQRRFDLEEKERDRRYETEKSLTDAEVKAKLADIELSKAKFEFDKTERMSRLATDINESKRKLDYEIEKFNHERDLQIKRLKLDAANSAALIAEKTAEIERYQSKSSNVIVPVLEKALPAALGLVGAVATIHAEETQIITSKGLNVFKSIK
jgi:hypothetical protein